MESPSLSVDKIARTTVMFAHSTKPLGVLVLRAEMRPLTPDLDHASVGKRLKENNLSYDRESRFFRGAAFFMYETNALPNYSSRDLYRSHLLLDNLGESGQSKLLNSKVLIIGLGGLGSSAAFYLTACGVGELGLADSDRVELSNLQRQVVHRFNDIGRYKVQSGGRNLLDLRPNLSFKSYPFRITMHNGADIISGYDFVIDCTDNFESKFAVNDLCVQLHKPFSHAGIVEFYGQTMTILPGLGPCLRCVFAGVPPADAVQSNDQRGVLGTVPGLLGVIQATEAIKHIVGCGELLVGRMLTWDAIRMVFREVLLPPGKRCPICQGVES